MHPFASQASPICIYDSDVPKAGPKRTEEKISKQSCLFQRSLLLPTLVGKVWAHLMPWKVGFPKKI